MFIECICTMFSRIFIVRFFIELHINQRLVFILFWFAWREKFLIDKKSLRLLFKVPRRQDETYNFSAKKQKNNITLK